MYVYFELLGFILLLVTRQVLLAIIQISIRLSVAVILEQICSYRARFHRSVRIGHFLSDIEAEVLH
jgi:hypothetical protein